MLSSNETAKLAFLMSERIDQLDLRVLVRPYIEGHRGGTYRPEYN